MLKLKKLDDLEKPYAIFTDQVESQAIEQFINVMSDVRILSGALMPDVHAGYTLPIGGVVASDHWVFPAFVGYDIGCGVSCVGIDYTPTKEFTVEFRDKVLNTVPTGFSRHTTPQLTAKQAEQFLHRNDCTDFCKDLFMSAGLYQLDTLGGGNHFIEVGVDTDNKLYVTVHCGSRNLGHSIASHYMGIAAGDNKSKEGVYGFHEESEQGKDYIRDMRTAEMFANLNRSLIIESLFKLLGEFFGEDFSPRKNKTTIEVTRNHNHAELRAGLWIHRKGATHAENGLLGVIPGNMRDGVFITSGRGNPDSLYSSSHGAGRAMSRSKAKDTLSMAAFEEDMQGIVAGVNQGALDESPQAYKNFAEVMEQQGRLCTVLRHIRPLLNVKG